MDSRLLMVWGLLLAASQRCDGLLNTCTLSDHFNMGIMERFVQSSIVLYGKTTQHHATKEYIGGHYQYVIDATFDVYCVIKRHDDTIPEQVVITRIAPRDECSGTDTHSLMKVGDHSIVALKATTTEGKYDFDEIMPATSAAVRALKPYLFSLSKMCDLQAWHAPTGAVSNRCPICGTADFEPEVLELENDKVTNCIHTTHAISANMTACDLYMEYSVDDANAQSCIPSTFDRSCVTLLTRTPTTVCDCNVKKDIPDIGVGAGSVLLPSMLLILITSLNTLV